MTDIKYQPSRAIIVLGMHRSGTSLIARGLQTLGVDLGDTLLSPSEDNPKGFWEDRDIVAINEELLALQGKAWDTLTWGEIKGFDGSEYHRLREKAKRLIEQRFLSSPLWGFKDPRTTRLLGFWLPLFEEINVQISFVIAIRKPVAVAQSLARRNGLPSEVSHILWLEYLKDAVEVGMSSACVLVDYDLMLGSPKQQLYRIAEQLEITPKENTAVNAFAEEFVEPALSHAPTLAGLTTGIATIAQNCYELLRRAAHDEVALTSEQFWRPWQKHIDEVSEQREGIAYIEQLELYARKARKKDLTALRDNYERRGVEIVRLEKELMNRGVEIERLDKEIVARDGEIARIEKELTNHSVEIERLEKELTNHSVEIERLNEDVIVRGKEIERLDKEILVRDDELTAIKNSTMWRISHPARWFYGKIFSLRQKFSQQLLNRFKDILRLSLAKWQKRIFSKNNSLSLNRMSEKRSSYACSEEQARLLLQKPHQWPLLTISVVTFNADKWLNNFIQSVRAQSYPLERITLLFIDHGSSDSTWKHLEQLQEELEGVFADFRCYQRPNKGFGCGHDFAIRQAVTDKVLVTNIDLEFLHDTLTQLVATAESDTLDVASWEACQLPYEHPKYYDPITLETAWSSHACILIDREKYLDVGGYEKRIFMYGEDVELSYRFRSYDYTLRYCPHAKVFHYTYETAGEVKPLQFAGSTLANTYIRLRYGSPRDVLAGYFLQLRLLLTGGGFPGSRRLVAKNIVKSVVQAPAFLFYTKRKEVPFSFYEFDYEMVRDGAFYELEPLPQGQLPRISVITRTVEGRSFLLREAIASVLNQTYPNIEHLIVEDGGNSAAEIVHSVAKRFCEKDGYSIRHIEAPKRGRSHAGNIGLENARGDYVVLLDDDDLIYPDHIEILYKAVIDKRVDAAYALAWEVLSKVNKDAECYEEEVYQTPPIFHQKFDREVLFDHNYLPLQSVLFSRSLFVRCGGFEEDMDYLEDWNLWCRYAVNHEFTFVPKTTSLYRTPSIASERIKRLEQLHDAYDDAKRRLDTLICESKQ